MSDERNDLSHLYLDPRAPAVIGYDPHEDRRRHTVSEGGGVVVTPGEECVVDSSKA